MKKLTIDIGSLSLEHIERIQEEILLEMYELKNLRGPDSEEAKKACLTVQKIQNYIFSQQLKQE